MACLALPRERLPIACRSGSGDFCASSPSVAHDTSSCIPTVARPGNSTVHPALRSATSVSGRDHGAGSVADAAEASRKTTKYASSGSKRSRISVDPAAVVHCRQPMDPAGVGHPELRHLSGHPELRGDRLGRRVLVAEEVDLVGAGTAVDELDVACRIERRSGRARPTVWMNEKSGWIPCCREHSIERHAPVKHSLSDRVGRRRSCRRSVPTPSSPALRTSPTHRAWVCPGATSASAR